MKGDVGEMVRSSFSPQIYPINAFLTVSQGEPGFDAVDGLPGSPGIKGPLGKKVTFKTYNIIT